MPTGSFDLAQTIVAIAGAAGLSGVLTIVTRGIFRSVTGRASRERARNSDYLARSIRDAELADAEAAKRRKTQEYASELRRQAIENGYVPLDWPADLEKTLTSAEVRKIRSKSIKEKQ